MIVALIAASLSATSPVTPHRVARQPAASPCQAVPALCIERANLPDTPRFGDFDASRPNIKMDAYRFESRPCRLIGNMDCPRQARRKILRWGEPVGRTLRRSFGLD